MKDFKLPSDYAAERAQKLKTLEYFYFNNLAEHRYQKDETMTLFDAAVAEAFAKLRRDHCPTRTRQ